MPALPPRLICTCRVHYVLACHVHRGTATDDVNNVKRSKGKGTDADQNEERA